MIIMKMFDEKFKLTHVWGGEGVAVAAGVSFSWTLASAVG